MILGRSGPVGPYMDKYYANLRSTSVAIRRRTTWFRTAVENQLTPGQTIPSPIVRGSVPCHDDDTGTPWGPTARPSAMKLVAMPPHGGDTAGSAYGKRDCA